MKIIDSNTNRKIVFSGDETDAYNYIIRFEVGNLQLDLRAIDFLKNDFLTMNQFLGSEVMQKLAMQMGFSIENSLTSRWLSRNREETYWLMLPYKDTKFKVVLSISFAEGPPNCFTITFEGAFVMAP